MKQFERAAIWVTFFMSLAIAATYFFTHVTQPKMPTSWDYKDVVSILLAIVTVALTILGIIIAVAAFWSYQKIIEIASDKAEHASKRTTTDYLDSTAFAARLDLIILERTRNYRKDQLEPHLDVSAPGGVEPVGDQPWEDS